MCGVLCIKDEFKNMKKGLFPLQYLTLMFLNTQQCWLSKCSCIHVVCMCMSVYLAFDGLLKVKSSCSSVKSMKNTVPQQEFSFHIT